MMSIIIISSSAGPSLGEGGFGSKAGLAKPAAAPAFSQGKYPAGQTPS